MRYFRSADKFTADVWRENEDHPIGFGAPGGTRHGAGAVAFRAVQAGSVLGGFDVVYQSLPQPKPSTLNLKNVFDMFWWCHTWDRWIGPYWPYTEFDGWLTWRPNWWIFCYWYPMLGHVCKFKLFLKIEYLISSTDSLCSLLKWHKMAMCVPIYREMASVARGGWAGLVWGIKAWWKPPFTEGWLKDEIK